MEINQVLKESGLNEKQANVYMALLELGTASVQLVAQKAGLKRPTTYLILEELEQKGLVGLVPQKKILYTAESPDRLIGDMNKRQEMLKRFMPDLLAIYNVKAEKPQVQLFPGQEGVHQVYDQILESGSVDFFGTIGDVQTYLAERLKEFQKLVLDGTLHARELFAPTTADKEYAKFFPNLPNYELRFVDSGISMPTDCALFKDTVALFFYKPQLFVLVIKSKDVCQSFQALYNLAWQTAIPSQQYLAK